MSVTALWMASSSAGKKDMMVLSNFLHAHRTRQYEVVPAEAIKQQILDWIEMFNFNSGQAPPRAVTICFVFHGHHTPRSLDSAAEGNAQLFSPDEVYPHINPLHNQSKISLLFCSCFSGKWVEAAVNLCTHPNLVVHSACQKDESAWALRSTSNQYRCMVAEACNLPSHRRWKHQILRRFQHNHNQKTTQKRSLDA
ncbi:hypothetical protein FN846DRAFT_438632 [Sphaerosporella brunnea]|uniref:Uncharacterized protein n=1 Tax=Sphaerosporella brunnea TaxID=1250544 RepID=A0A5J5F4G7_9PEZI|nr:hypothetical protein FN846DRAFT_438632 [Sphaerosporella brunnea]